MGFTFSQGDEIVNREANAVISDGDVLSEENTTGREAETTVGGGWHSMGEGLFKSPEAPDLVLIFDAFFLECG